MLVCAAAGGGGMVQSEALPSHLKEIWDKYLRKHFAYPAMDLFTSKEWMSIVLQDAGILVPVGKVHDEGLDQKEDENYVFMHQNFRDCLAGLYLVNQAETAATGAFPKVWEQIQSHLALKYVAELMEQNKRNVLQLLWDTNREAWKHDGAGANNIAICNLLELCRRNGRLLEKVELSFSGMDLSGLSLARYLGGDGPMLPLFQNRLQSAGASISRQTFQSEGHGDWVNCAAALPDGRVVSGSSDRTLRVWDPTTGECLRELRGHGGWVRCAAALPDGRVVSGSSDNTLRVWDPTTGECLRELRGNGAWVNCAAALPDGRVVSGSIDNTLRVWDPTTGECLDVLETTEVDVSHMDFSDAILTEDLARLLWHGRAKISDADYERYVKPYRKPYKHDGQATGDTPSVSDS